MLKSFRYAAYLLTALIAVGIGICFLILMQSLPVVNGEIEMDFLSAPVSVRSGRHGIPAIEAENRADAIRALGFVTARDRLFQMDLIRRRNAGALSEIFGEAALANDIRSRTLGFNRLAKRIAEKLSLQHKSYLRAYAEGVNAFIARDGRLPFEFDILSYRPSLWTIEDSIMAALGMFDLLTGWSEREERMLSIMEKTLPADLFAFLTPDTDFYTDRLMGHSAPSRPEQPVPVGSMAKALARYLQESGSVRLAGVVNASDTIPGSNAWVVGAKKTQDGRAILASDMHLSISVPNIWYRAQVQYGAVRAEGLTLPGLPIIIAGSNHHVAWGETNLSGDFLDLASLDINPDNPDEYRFRGQWRRFDTVTETIAVKGGENRILQVRQTVWGPVSSEPLLGKQVAVHWTALDDKAFEMGLIDMLEAETLNQALAIVRRTSGPQLNVLVADDKGHIAWALMGNVPVRKGGDGSVSRSWSDGRVDWDGYLNASDLPLLIDPPQGFLVSANHRRFGKELSRVIGRQFANGYRAFRISQELERRQNIVEKSMFALQLDFQTEFYDFYKALALSVLPSATEKAGAELSELRDYVLAWHGRAGADSLGLPLLVEFRKQLAQSVLKPFLAACVREDKNFSYSWTYLDTPLQALLTGKVPELLPDPVNYRSWNEFILAQLKRSARMLKADYPDIPLARLTWGEVNRAHFKHPFSGRLPSLGHFLDMPADKLAGCTECIRVATPYFGATERLVVSPGHHEDGILHMPGGQSGHPLSPFYKDQHEFWVNGRAIPLSAEYSRHKLVLKPPVRK